MTYYDILQVNTGASGEVIAGAYKALCKLHHPDVGGNVEAFKSIQVAYDCLSSEEKRREYDRGLEEQARAEKVNAYAYGAANGYANGNGHVKPNNGYVPDVDEQVKALMTLGELFILPRLSPELTATYKFAKGDVQNFIGQLVRKGLGQGQ